MRLVVIGGPKTGKTTLFPDAIHTDDTMDMGWSESSEHLARRMLAPGPYVIEGVTAVRALRKALGMSEQAPCGKVLYLTEAKTPTTAGQRAMSKGIQTIFGEIRADLERRGVEIEVR